MALLVAMSTSAAVLPTAANAAYLAKGTPLRGCVNLGLAGCKQVWTNLPSGQSVQMHCYKDQSYWTGRYKSERWFYIKNSSHQHGFVHSSDVEAQSSVGKCEGHRGISVATWAVEHVGVATTTSTERSYGTGVAAYWSGYCSAFETLAFKIGGRVTPRHNGDAKQKYDAYKKANLAATSGTPNIGAAVFWPNVSRWGHVAIYVGNGKVATTTGIPGGTSANERRATSAYGTPAGWVNPPNI